MAEHDGEGIERLMEHGVAGDRKAPCVLAIDLGTSSVRALVFDDRARPLAESETQIPFAQRTPPGGGVETDAPALFDLLVRCLDETVRRAHDRGNRIAAVGVTSFWHSLLGLDRSGQPSTPLYSWADARAATHARRLADEVDAAALYHRTGCRLHSSYWPAKLRWLASTDPSVCARTAYWVSFAEYAATRLFGAEGRVVSLSMASGTGLLDVHRCDWDAAACAIAGVDRAQLSPLVDVTESCTLDIDFARRWPSLAEVPWFPALGDGAAANVGSGALGPARFALTLGTSGALRLVLPAPPGHDWTVPDHLWAYRLNRELIVVGGALSNGGNLLAWLRGLLDVEVAEAMDGAGAIPPDGHGLTLLPFVAGERSPGWYDQPNGVVAGLTLATKPEHLLRAAMEAVAFRFARIYEALCPLAAEPHAIVANGGAILNSPPWLQITADVLGHTLLALPPDAEASARGAAVAALVAAGIVSSLDAVPDPAANATRIDPDGAVSTIYRAARARHEALETRLFAAPLP